MEPWAVAKDQNEDDTPVEKFADEKDMRIWNEIRLSLSEKEMRLEKFYNK